MKSRIMFALILLICTIIYSGCSKQQEPISREVIMENIPQVTEIETETNPTIQTEQLFVTEAEPKDPCLLDKEPGAYQLRFESKDSDEYMDYYLFVPENAVEDLPIVVFLHGSVEIGHVELLEDYGIVSVVKTLYGDEFPFLLLLPCTHKPSWTGNGVPETLIELIKEVSETYNADKERICITGHSLGSVGTWKMISEYGDFFSCAVPISCGIDEPMDYDNCANVAITAYAGTVGADEKNYNPAMHKLVESICAVGGNAQMRVIEGADHEAMVTAAYTTELFDWILSQ